MCWVRLGPIIVLSQRVDVFENWNNYLRTRESFDEFITRLYGADTKKKCRQRDTFSQKKCELVSDLAFMKRCTGKDVTSNCVKTDRPTDDKKAKNIFKIAEKRLSGIKEIGRKLSFTDEKFAERKHIILCFRHKTDTTANVNARKKHNKKTINNKKSAVVNLTNNNFTENEISLLEKYG